MKFPFSSSRPPTQLQFKSPGSNENPLAAGQRTYTELIHPSGIDASFSGYTLIDGTYTTVLLALNYPYNVKGAWMDELVNAGDGIEISLYHFPQPKLKIQKDITTQMGFTKYKLSEGGDTQLESELQTNSLSHSYYIKKKLAEGDDFWYFHLLIRVSAFDPDTLQDRINTATSILSGKDIFYARADFRQLEAFLSTLPFCDLHPSFRDETARNAVTSGLCSTYPFTSYELSDPEGTFIGTNEHNGSATILDIFNTQKYPNANVTIVGASGSGKTATTQILAYRMRLQGIPSMLICPLKGFEYKPLCDAVGGFYFRIAPGSAHTINMLDIRPTSNEQRDESLLDAKLQKLQIFFSLIFPKISPLERQLLEEALISVYADKGITKDNQSLYQEQTSGFSFRPRMKRMPVLGDLYSVISIIPALQEIAAQLVPYVSGSMSFLNGETNVDLTNDYIVADISDMQGDSIALGMLLVWDILWDKVKQNINQKKCLIIDEAWQLIGAGGNAQTARHILEAIKTIRSLGGSCIIATQDVTDFLALEDGKYGKAILKNSALKLVLRLEELDVEALSSVVRLSEEEARRLPNLKRGNALLFTGDTHVAISVKLSEYEKRLITTDRSERLKYLGEGVS